MTTAIPESFMMAFAHDVSRGLTARPKTLPSKYFYDALGSTLFEAISLLPEYYLTRAETEIFELHAGDIIDALRPERIIELGSGSAVKTRILLDAAFARRRELAYSAIDISKTALESTAKALESEYPRLTVEQLPFDYFEGLGKLSRNGASPVLALFLGSNIGNFEPQEAQRFLRSIREVLNTGDALLLGTDLKKDKAVLELAYDDPLGVTAAFNLNILNRINHELGGNFELCAFRHKAFYNVGEGRVEMHLASERRQSCFIRDLPLEVAFEAGETIHTESSYKFSMEDVSQLARASGFMLQKSWTDKAARFACNLLAVSPLLPNG